MIENSEPSNQCGYLVVLIVLAITGGCHTQENAPVTAFIGVNVVHPELNLVEPQQTVIVTGTKITAMGPGDKLKPPKGAHIVDGGDKFLIAGLTEMHAHVPHSKMGEAYLHDQENARDCGQAVADGQPDDQVGANMNTQGRREFRVRPDRAQAQPRAGGQPPDRNECNEDSNPCKQ